MTEADPPGTDFLARVCVDWESEAESAEQLGIRVALIRTGIVLDRNGGALAKMLPFFAPGSAAPSQGVVRRCRGSASTTRSRC